VNRSTSVLSMYVEADEEPAGVERSLQAVIDRSLPAGELGLNPLYADQTGELSGGLR
jgi:hypothetical protein